MQTEKDLFEVIKQSYPLQPREDFVLGTEGKLRRMARELDRKRKIKRFSFATTGTILSVLILSWFFIFNGKEAMLNSLSLQNSYHNGQGHTVTQKQPLFVIQSIESEILPLNVEGIDQPLKGVEYNVLLYSEEMLTPERMSSMQFEIAGDKLLKDALVRSNGPLLSYTQLPKGYLYSIRFSTYYSEHYTQAVKNDRNFQINVFDQGEKYHVQTNESELN